VLAADSAWQITQYRPGRDRYGRPFALLWVLPGADCNHKMHKQIRTLDELAALVERLERQLLALPRLHVKDVCRRYCISKSTFYRWRQRRKLPPPSVILGGPLWRLEDLERFEDDLRTRDSRTKLSRRSVPDLSRR
jgi:hypothetical protein